MGTGGYGRGGGGGGGAGGGGGGPGGYGTESVSDHEIKKIIKDRLDTARKSTHYFHTQLGGPLVNAVYRELFQIASCLRSATPVEALLAKYAVDSGRGFLRQLSNHIMEKYRHLESNGNIKDTLRRTLEEFFLRLMGGDADMLVRGTAKQIVHAVDQDVLASISGFFLWFFLWELAIREGEPPSPSVEADLKSEVENVANQVINDYEKKFATDGKVPYRDLFTKINENLDWFNGVVRQCLSNAK